MNSTQIQSTLAPLISFLAGLAAGKGLFGLDSATWATLLGGAAAFAATIWGAIATRSTAIISQAAASPEVQSIKLTPNASLETVNATPGNVNK